MSSNQNIQTSTNKNLQKEIKKQSINSTSLNSFLKNSTSLSSSSSFSSKSKHSFNSLIFNRSKTVNKLINPFFKKLNGEKTFEDKTTILDQKGDFEFGISTSQQHNMGFDLRSQSTVASLSSDFLITPKISNISLESSVNSEVPILSDLKNDDYKFSSIFENSDNESAFFELDDIHNLSQEKQNFKQNAPYLSVSKFPREKIHSYIQQLSSSGIILTKVSRKKKVKYTFKLLGNQLLNWKDKYVDLSQIKDIRVFGEGANYREQFNISKEVGGNWITIIYQVPKNKLKAVHCYSSSNSQILKFYISILYLVKKKHEMVEQLALPNIDEFIDYHWKDSSFNGLEFTDVKKLCAKFNIFCSEKYLKNLFEKSDLNNDNLLDYLEFQTFVKFLKKKPDIEAVYKKYTSKVSSLMTIDDFRNFLLESQRITDKSEQDEILNSLNVDYDNNAISLLEFTIFLEKEPYLQNSDNDSSYYDHPLNQYFISSSHNTYLRGSQIGDGSTIESYIEVLQKGCRCVEVDVWDGEDGPVVCHGILSGSISLKSVLEVIRKYAFITSSFPLIVSFEVHCKSEYQYVMIYLIKDYFQGFLHHKFEDGRIPTPNELKGKVILKFTKRGKIYENDNDSNESSSDDEFISNIKQELSPSGNSKFNLTDKYKKRVSILPELLQLAAIQGIKYRNFQLPESKKLEHSFSLSEKQLNEMKEETLTRYFIDKHNRRFFMRIYPHAFRYKSTNFNNPLEYWELGVQMVAINWQTNDLGQCLNIAMFKQPISNDGTTQWNSGYVLKPGFMLPKVKVKEMKQFYANVDKNMPVVTYEIDLISGHLLNKPDHWNISNNIHAADIDLVVEYEIFTIKKNESLIGNSLNLKNGTKIGNCKGQTKYFRDNGICPIWNSKLTFQTKYPEFTILSLKVKTRDGYNLGECYVKVYDLKQGYRHIPLNNATTGENFIFSKLFLKIICIDNKI